MHAGILIWQLKMQKVKYKDDTLSIIQDQALVNLPSPVFITYIINQLP